MSVPDERFPRPRALRGKLPRQAASETAADDAWFTYRAAGDEITWSESLATMLGRPPAGNEVSRQVLNRYVHRDDLARALGAITRTWTGGEPVRMTVRLMRADGGWFDVDCRLEPQATPDGRVRGIRGTVTDVSARERARREVDRLARRGETVLASLIERDPVTELLTRARLADEIDRSMRRGGGAVLVIRVQPDRAELKGHDLLNRAARLLEGVVQPADVLGRTGPNEIAVLLPGTSWAMARRQAALFVEALVAHPFVLPPDAWMRARAWAGLVRFQAGAEASSHDLLIDAEHAWRQGRDADRALTRSPYAIGKAHIATGWPPPSAPSGSPCSPSRSSSCSPTP
jgi:PAS domain S-box-containing protein